MLKHIKAAVVPVVLVAAIAGAAGYRAQDSGSGRRLDELSKERPAAASHLPVDGALLAASQAADEARLGGSVQCPPGGALLPGSRSRRGRAGRGGRAGGGSCQRQEEVRCPDRSWGWQ